MSLTDRKRFAWLTAQGMTDAGAAADMANSYYESGLKSNNLQNTYNSSLGMTDAEYTATVDDGSYTDFSSDSAGYGLYQWTYKTRKAALLKYVQAANKSIGDDETQLKFHIKELKESYSSVWKTLTASTDVKECSDTFMCKYENPADQSTAAKNKRSAKAQEYFEKYAAAASTSGMTNNDCPFKVKVSASNLNIRTGAGTNYSKTGKYTGAGVFTITQVKSGTGSSVGWGKLKSGAGWISLDFCTLVS